jgi:precorrin-3B methylase
MGWHVRYESLDLKREVMSPEMASEVEALEAAWTLAQEGNQIIAVEGPDGELAGMDEVQFWFDNRPPDPAA